jgi:hypothetical protein
MFLDGKIEFLKQEIKTSNCLILFFKLPAATIKSNSNVLFKLFEAFGESTNNGQAKVFAQSWKATSDLLFNLRNKYGGATPYLKNWGLPQTHNNLILCHYT